MTMKRRAWILLPVVLGFLAVWIYTRGPETPPAPPPVAVEDREIPVEAIRPSEAPRNPSSPLAQKINQLDHSPQRDLEIVYTLLNQTRLFVKDLATRPLGTNAEFTAVLTGNNSLRLAAIPANHPAINESGELTDRWGTPLFFHPLSSDETNLRSAGPDRQLFTEDDFVYPEK